MRESNQIPKESGRIRTNPREDEGVWANFERIEATPEKSERIEMNTRESG